MAYSKRDSTNLTLFQKTKKPDPILDIPEISFNVDHYRQTIALPSADYTISIKDTHLQIGFLQAPNSKPGSGFGTAFFRHIVEQSLDFDCPGKIEVGVLSGYGSPHLFYVYMGMAPKIGLSEYLGTQYGTGGYDARDKLQNLNKYKKWSTEILETECDEYILDELKRILRKEQKINRVISLDDIVANREFLLNLLKDKCDYGSDVFMPNLLKILAEDPTNKYPNTKSLGTMTMYLTEQGYTRWKYVIDHKLEFVPFRNFEHFDLNLEQRTLLQSILDKRAETSVRLTT